MASLTTTQLISFSLTVKAHGSAPYYQWYHGVTPLGGANLPTFTLPAPEVVDSGNYYCIVSNGLGRATSTVAQVTVVADTFAPQLVSATTYPQFDMSTLQATLTGVTLHFNERLDPAHVDPQGFDFTITSGAGSIGVLSETLSDNGTDIILTTDPQDENTLYTVVAINLQDLVGNVVNPAHNTTTFQSWVSTPANGLLYEYFPLDDPNTINTIDFFTSSTNFPNYPTFVTNLWGFDSRIVFPDDSHDHYGSRTRGLFIPPVTGGWRFYVRSDDPSQVFFNPTGTTEAGKLLVVEETACCNDWNAHESAPFALQAGQGYYIEALQKEGGGADYIKVAARLDGSGAPPTGVPNTVIDTNVIMGSAVGYPYAPVDIGGGLTVSGPADVTVAEDQLASFSVVASNPSGMHMVYQWRSNDVDIAGATGTNFAFNPARADDGTHISVQVAKLGSVLVSREALVTVLSDTTPPTVVSVHGTYSLDKIIVNFSELVDPVTATDLGSYDLTDGPNIIGWTMGTNGSSVILQLDAALTPGASYHLHVSGVQDIASVPNTIVDTTVTVPAFVYSPGFLRFDYFANTGTSPAIDGLLNDPRYPDFPDSTFYIPALDSRTIFPDDSHEAYGDHIRGFFIPPADGNYIFYLRSDDTSQLFINSSGPDAAGATKVQEETTCCRAFSALPTSPMAMTAGQHYYIEVNHKEGTGGDFVQVAAQLDTDPTPPDSLLPIPGSYLATLVDPLGSSITITQQPTAQVVGVDPAVAPVNYDFTQGPGNWTASATPSGPLACPNRPIQPATAKSAIHPAANSAVAQSAGPIAIAPCTAQVYIAAQTPMLKTSR